MIYLMSDLHGDYNRFKLMLKKIDFKDSDTLYILGDVVDRGLNGIKILKYIMDKRNIELLIGNHEDWFLKYIKEPNNKEHANFWLRYGGEETLEEYNQYPNEEKKEIIDYLNSCKTFKLIELNNKMFFLSHAGLYFDGRMRNYSIEQIIDIQERSDFIFNTIPLFNLGNISELLPKLKDVIFVFGHYPKNYILQSFGFKKEKLMTFWKDKKNKDKICLDCGTFLEEGQLGCLRLNDLKEFYIK